VGGWGVGVGGWGLGVGAQPPNPQSPIPNPHPQSPNIFSDILIKIVKFKYLLNQNIIID